MRILVCGSRHFSNPQYMYSILDRLHDDLKIDAVIHGAARGADALAGTWAMHNNVFCQPYPADWNQHGKTAGPIRNRLMLTEGRPDLVVAFMDGAGPGTNNMITQAQRAGVNVRKCFSS